MIRVYGSKVSYFTGKLEVYLRYRGIDYELVPLSKHRKHVLEKTGSTQMPVIELEDGRWMSDTTPIIQYFEREVSGPPVIPLDPVLRFIGLLIEDYADEWLWRPAMHYRWSHRHDRELLSGILVDEQLGHMALPRFVKLRLLRRRQRGGFVLGDGVSDETRHHVELGYFAALENMSRMLEGRRFLLGDSPSIADVGLMGPMLRHFGQDPTPTELMRERAPRVYEWVAQMWNARAANAAPNWDAELSREVQPMLREICETHLVQQRHNAAAFESGTRRFQMTIQGCEYRAMPVSRYRVWCLEQLRREFRDLSADDQRRLKSLLQYPDAEILWTEDFHTRSGYDEKAEAPFNRAINVYGQGVPR